MERAALLIDRRLIIAALYEMEKGCLHMKQRDPKSDSTRCHWQFPVDELEMKEIL